MLGIYSRSPVVYRELQKFPFFALPSESTLKKVLSDCFKFPAGPACQEHIAQQKERYAEMKAAGGKCKGVLIFDETKLIPKLAYNSKSHELYGTATSQQEFASLYDVYQTISESSGSQLGEYALQFLWKDLTSNFEVLGPYWISSSSLKTPSLWTCVYESMRIFNAYGFQILALVADGASYNLSLFKELCGCKPGAFGVGKVNPIPEDPYSVPCTFRDYS